MKLSEEIVHPCPWSDCGHAAGEEPKVLRGQAHLATYGIAVKCPCCALRGPVCQTEPEAVDAWNSIGKGIAAQLVVAVVRNRKLHKRAGELEQALDKVDDTICSLIEHVNTNAEVNTLRDLRKFSGLEARAARSKAQP